MVPNVLKLMHSTILFNYDFFYWRRNINNLRYEDDTTLMAESKEPKSFLMKEERRESLLKGQHLEN